MGPIGAIFGFAIGSMIERSTTDVMLSENNGQTRGGDLIASLLVLTAALMKADGKVLKSELNFVKNFLVQQFGEEAAKEHLQTLKLILDKNIPVNEVAQQVGRYMDYSSKLQLVHYLWGIASADADIDESEVILIEEICYHMGINKADSDSVKAMFVKDAESAYKILEISPDATDEEVKKAYRNMAVKYHPDKVSHLGDEFKKSAEEKFSKVNHAYDEVKKSRGIK